MIPCFSFKKLLTTSMILWSRCLPDINWQSCISSHQMAMVWASIPHVSTHPALISFVSLLGRMPASDWLPNICFCLISWAWRTSLCYLLGLPCVVKCMSKDLAMLDPMDVFSSLLFFLRERCSFLFKFHELGRMAQGNVSLSLRSSSKAAIGGAGIENFIWLF